MIAWTIDCTINQLSIRFVCVCVYSNGCYLLALIVLSLFSVCRSNGRRFRHIRTWYMRWPTAALYFTSSPQRSIDTSITRRFTGTSAGVSLVCTLDTGDCHWMCMFECRLFPFFIWSFMFAIGALSQSIEHI